MGSGATTPLVSDDEDEEMEDLDEVDDFGYYVEQETFNDQKKLPDVRFCDRNIFNRVIFSRWIRVTDMRVGEASDSDEDEASSKDSHDSDGESRKEDVAESKEGNGGSEDGSKAEDGEEDGKADSDASDEEENDDDDDLGSIKSSEPEDDESSDMDSMSELDDDEVKSVYLQVTVHQREWRLFIVAYEPLERKILQYQISRDHVAIFVKRIQETRRAETDGDARRHRLLDDNGKSRGNRRKCACFPGCGGGRQQQQ